MKLSHILIKVPNLEAALREYQEQGFHTEYGSKSKPHNAVIYFSEGPYIELLEKAPISTFTKWVLKLIGKGKAAERLDGWGKANEGPFEICLENYNSDFKEEESILKKHGIGHFITNSKRLDPHGRLLKWKMLFPNDLRLPFFMTYFNQDPKPDNFIHPNGTVRIQKVSFAAPAELINLLRELCDDDTLELFEGEKEVRDIIYEKQ